MPTVGMTALHYASLTDSVALVELLIRFEADPNIEDQTGCKPIDYTENSRIKRRLETYMKEHAERKAEQERVEAIKQAEAAKKARREFPLEQRLHQYIVGQDGPIMAVAAAVRRYWLSSGLLYFYRTDFIFPFSHSVVNCSPTW